VRHQKIDVPEQSLLRRLFPTLSNVNPDVTWMDWVMLVMGFFFFLAPTAALVRGACGLEVTGGDIDVIRHPTAEDIRRSHLPPEDPFERMAHGLSPH
jgi:hypothetical protein